MELLPVLFLAKHPECFLTKENAILLQKQEQLFY